jgi:hypothetical protein
METLKLTEREYGTEAVGNNLMKLVARNKERLTNPLIEAHMDHDIGIMFMFQATEGILKNSFGTGSKLNKPFLDKYLVDISIFEDLYKKYNTQGKGIKFELAFITDKEYIKYTGNKNIPTTANKFLYFIATPIDSNNNPVPEHYIIFNLNHKFEIDKDFINDMEADNLTKRYTSDSIFTKISVYCSPLRPTEHIFYTWADINAILNERNIEGKLYKELQFVLGEVIRFDIISDYFKGNPYYDFDEEAYKIAYLGHEKRLTMVGKYLPDDIVGKEGFFDMGSLYP